ncbi:MAG TPA: DUF177 domain-containing protein [Thermomicrobiaceae bacterium]|nr:DUF177 domain-containing protein [Thermomicrobiaceae bacterium]
MALHLLKLVDDTVVNVAQLLKQPVGAARALEAHLGRFQLDVDLWARDVEVSGRLIRIETGILVQGTVRGIATLECVRCLEEFDAPFEGQFDAEFWPSIEVRTGLPLPLPEDDEIFVIDHNHEMDLAEVLRQISIVSLPMRPVCGDNCPGFQAEFPAVDASEDDRLAVLRRLLDETSE